MGIEIHHSLLFRLSVILYSIKRVAFIGRTCAKIYSLTAISHCCFRISVCLFQLILIVYDRLSNRFVCQSVLPNQHDSGPRVYSNPLSVPVARTFVGPFHSILLLVPRVRASVRLAFSFYMIAVCTMVLKFCPGFVWGSDETLVFVLCVVQIIRNGSNGTLSIVFRNDKTV